MQHVVIVDDDPLHRKLVTDVVRDIRGTVTHPFASSDEALRWSATHDVDCFILDYRMPAPDGIEMTRILRSIERFALVPIVLVTGVSEREVRRRALRSGASDFVEKPIDYHEFVARISTSLALQEARRRLELDVSSLESSLIDAEARSRQHAERLETLWRIVDNPTLRDDELLFVMLREGASAIRPKQLFHGMLLRIDGASAVVEALYRSERDSLRVDANVALGRPAPGLGELLATPGIRSWDDVEADAPTEARSCAIALGWRSLLVAPFSAGHVGYALAFASFLPTGTSFGPQDHAYVEILASLFATRLQQRWQAERITFQLQHDSLTGLLNRVQVRIAGRSAFRNAPNLAVAIVDIDHLRLVNARYGHIIGDAILVEVGASLARTARDDEIIARVGGDSFAVVMSAGESQRMTAERLSTYLSLFETPFSTGDRDGKESVAVSATIGVAVGPTDGASFDELLVRAEAVTIEAKASARARIAFASTS